MRLAHTYTYSKAGKVPVGLLNRMKVTQRQRDTLVQQNLNYPNCHSRGLSERYFEFYNLKRQFDFLPNQVINEMPV